MRIMWTFLKEKTSVQQFWFLGFSMETLLRCISCWSLFICATLTFIIHTFKWKRATEESHYVLCFSHGILFMNYNHDKGTLGLYICNFYMGVPMLYEGCHTWGKCHRKTFIRNLVFSSSIKSVALYYKFVNSSFISFTINLVTRLIYVNLY